jgi:hypothetical protein
MTENDYVDRITAIGTDIGRYLAKLAPEAHPIPNTEDWQELFTHVVNKVRAKAGRERAARELREIFAKAERFGHTIKVAASNDLTDFRTRDELVLLAYFIDDRADEIEREVPEQ